ncbi:MULTISPECIES: CaiB/BaiF CoA transferase family protein [Pseudoalteromonas]|uniref:CaiB/BaiF CoA transferase family protein n=1 Tax=Pseudoalteromonas TaxID=53246 RepID=UPI000F767AA9|nr:MULTISPECIES: CaiB/BaiF CoA-transferase family protein [Pseudoalteromonas]MEC4091413.1 CaiB/BaiF CoA-transferase family protein [Pseudoalteromonas rubra]
MINQTQEKPLSGITVIDLTRVLAGPFCTMMLADQGARVIKVELSGSGDDARMYGPNVNEMSGYFASINRGKESIALNLKDEEDRKVFEALLAKADVLTENFRPGVMERLGYDWPTLHSKFPRLIYGAISGFGQHGSPHRDKPAYDMVVQGMGGIMTVTGHKNTPPTRVGVSIGDLSSGLYLTIGVLMSLNMRHRTQVGNQIDIAMLDCQLALLEYSIMRHHATGEIPSPVGTYRPAIAPPFGMFAARGGYMVIATGNETLFGKLCDVLGHSELKTDPRFNGPEARKDNEEELQQLLEDILSQATPQVWVERLSAHGVPCGPVNNVAQMLSDPHVQLRNMLVTTEGGFGPEQIVGTPLKFSNVADMTSVRCAPTLDQDRDTILRDFGIVEEALG